MIRTLQGNIPQDPRHEAAEEPERHVLQGGCSARTRAVENVQALVHPRVLELVVADEPVPELVAGLVHRHAFR